MIIVELSLNDNLMIRPQYAWKDRSPHCGSSSHSQWPGKDQSQVNYAFETILSTWQCGHTHRTSPQSRSFLIYGSWIMEFVWTSFFFSSCVYMFDSLLHVHAHSITTSTKPLWYHAHMPWFCIKFVMVLMRFASDNIVIKYSYSYLFVTLEHNTTLIITPPFCSNAPRSEPDSDVRVNILFEVI